jgi:hypothetical protein
VGHSTDHFLKSVSRPVKIETALVILIKILAFALKLKLLLLAIACFGINKEILLTKAYASDLTSNSLPFNAGRQENVSKVVPCL